MFDRTHDRNHGIALQVMLEGEPPSLKTEGQRGAFERWKSEAASIVANDPRPAHEALAEHYAHWPAALDLGADWLAALDPALRLA